MGWFPSSCAWWETLRKTPAQTADHGYHRMRVGTERQGTTIPVNGEAEGDRRRGKRGSPDFLRLLLSMRTVSQRDAGFNANISPILSPWAPLTL